MLDGVDCSAIELKSLRKAVGIIPQDPLLFSGSLRSNLDPAGAHGDDEIGAHNINVLFSSHLGEVTFCEFQSCTHCRLLLLHPRTCAGSLQPRWDTASLDRGPRIGLGSRVGWCKPFTWPASAAVPREGTAKEAAGAALRRSHGHS
jgi:hypothetical protein